MPTFVSYPQSTFDVSIPVGSTLAATTGELIVTGMQLVIPANSVRVGTVFKIHYSTTATTAQTWLFNVRIGTGGTTSDTLILPGVATTSTNGACLDAYIAVQTTGSSGTMAGYMNYSALTAGSGTAITPNIFDTASTVSINTTVANYLSLTVTRGGTGTITNRVARIQGFY